MVVLGEQTLPYLQQFFHVEDSKSHHLHLQRAEPEGVVVCFGSTLATAFFMPSKGGDCSKIHKNHQLGVGARTSDWCELCWVFSR